MLDEYSVTSLYYYNCTFILQHIAWSRVLLQFYRLKPGVAAILSPGAGCCCNAIAWSRVLLQFYRLEPGVAAILSPGAGCCCNSIAWSRVLLQLPVKP